MTKPKNTSTETISSTAPRVTVGVPVYNNERTLRDCVASAAIQLGGKVQILLSDDGSSDSSWRICQELEREHECVRAVKQDKNLYYMNFSFLLNQASTEFFCWLAADDRMHPQYIERCIEILDGDESAVACVADCLFSSEENTPLGLASGTFEIQESCASERILKYLADPADNTRMYGVFRTGLAQASFPESIFHAYDWAFSAMTLCHGRHRAVKETLLFRVKTPSENYNPMVNRDERGLYRLFPVFSMSRFLWRQEKFPRSFRVFKRLLSLNLKKHIEYVRSERPAVAKTLGPLHSLIEKHLLWRL